MKTATGNAVESFCQEVKKMAKNYVHFDAFFPAVNDVYKNQTVMHKKEFNRLVQVAAVEANLI